MPWDPARHILLCNRAALQRDAVFVMSADIIVPHLYNASRDRFQETQVQEIGASRDRWRGGRWVISDGDARYSVQCRYRSKHFEGVL